MCSTKVVNIFQGNHVVKTHAKIKKVKKNQDPFQESSENHRENQKKQKNQRSEQIGRSGPASSLFAQIFSFF